MKTANKLLMAGCALLALPMISNAYCINNGNIFIEHHFTLPGNLNIQADKFNVGDTLWISPRLYNGVPVNSISCDGNPNDYEWGVITSGPLTIWPIATNVGGTPTVPPPNRVVYQSNIPGIGVAWYFHDDAADPLGSHRRPLYSYTNKAYWRSLQSSITLTYRNSWDSQLELVKTGDVPAGGYTLNLAGSKAQIWYGGNNAPGAAGSAYSGSFYLDSNIVISNAFTCQLSYPNVVVPLPKISTATLAGPINTYAGDTNFDINMTCGGAKVYYSLTGNTNVAWNNLSFLQPAGGTGAATGVAIQIRDRATGTAVILDGRDNFLADTTGQSSVPVKLQLKARYYRAEANISPGLVNGSVALNMSYQ